MLRHVAFALACALSVFAIVSIVYGWFADPPTRGPASAAAATRSEIYGRVRPVEPPNPSRLFQVAARFAPAARPKPEPGPEIGPRPVAVFDPDPLFPAFDPDLYRQGKVGEPLSESEICEVVEDVANEFEIPVPLFTRLIWQESRFRNQTVSRAGAQGIAQFMPETAEDRGLVDPFDPLQALPASADFLRDLINQFGNFGLAAAAYNGGPTRVRSWLAGRTRLPSETRNYVLHITGRKPEYWAKKAARADPHPEAFAVEGCDVKPIRAALGGGAAN